MTNCHLAASLSWPGCPSSFQRSCSCCPGAWSLFHFTHSPPVTQAPVFPTRLVTSLQLQTAGSNERKMTFYSSTHLAGKYYSLELKIIAWKYPRTLGSMSWKGCSVISSSLSSTTELLLRASLIGHSASACLCLSASRHDELTALQGS